jgi:DNA repair protein RecN (Recombination protein N)
MLTDLIIKNFVLIDRLQVSFGPGFNVLTGETGAGKSIIIDAVGLLLGDRARPDLIRTGEEEAVIEAMFDLTDHPDVCRELAESGFEEGEELGIKRVISRGGKNRIFVNGSLATLAQLQRLTSKILTIYGQHEHQTLQRPETHLVLLDRFGGLHGELGGYRRAYQEFLTLRDHVQNLEKAERERRQRLDYLSFQSREIAKADLRPDEDEALAAERLILQHAERLMSAVSGGYETLYGAEGAVCERLGAVAGELTDLSKIDARLGPWAESVTNCLYTLEEVARELRAHGEGISFDPQRRQEVDERLALLTDLKRKYGPSLPEILELKEKVDREIEELDDIETARADARKNVAAAEARLRERGEALSKLRRQRAQKLQNSIEKELQGLAMAKARIEMRFSALEEPGPRGLEDAEFYLAPNPGEEPKPLSRIASGGELSRIMLALRRAAPGAEGGSTLIFDEVDAGIGGQAATAVGEKLHAVARSLQVLCITHLPQVAAFAGTHYRVEKRVEGGRTYSFLRQLEGEDRVLEMARMLGGARLTERTLEHAREMIAQPGQVS